MRILILALALAAAPCVAGAQGAGAGGGAGLAGPELRQRMQPRTVPSGAPREAEQAVEHDLGVASVARFRDVRANEVAAVRRGAFEEPINGPISVVCGEFSLPAKAGGYSPYSWFFAAIKDRRLLWTAVDKDPATPGEAYYSCKGAGLTNDSPPESLPDD